MIELVEVQVSEQNRRFSVRLSDGAAVEAVLYREDSLCISCQVGCAVGCPFCASGARGLSRPLSFEELTQQVEAVLALGAPLKRITVSGVGEPLHNRDVLELLTWCRARRLAPSVTTSGGPLDRLRQLLRAPHNGVTVSIHAGTEATRARAVPKGPPLGPLFEVLSDELSRASRSRRRKIALAYLLVDGLNDADEEVDAFIERARPLSAWTHLYAYNPVPGGPERPVSRPRYEQIHARMREAGLKVRMSSQARLEPNGGCGTLVALPRPSRSRRAGARRAGGRSTSR